MSESQNIRELLETLMLVFLSIYGLLSMIHNYEMDTVIELSVNHIAGLSFLVMGAIVLSVSILQYLGVDTNE